MGIKYGNWKSALTTVDNNRIKTEQKTASTQRIASLELERRMMPS